MLTDLVGGPWQLPRATGTGGATWLPETGTASTNEAAFDQVTLTASRISANSIVSKQLVTQAQPDIERFLVDELGQAIATEVDRVVLNGSGGAPVPLGILNLPVNPASTYAYNARSPNVQGRQSCRTEAYRSPETDDETKAAIDLSAGPPV